MTSIQQCLDELHQQMIRRAKCPNPSQTPTDMEAARRNLLDEILRAHEQRLVPIFWQCIFYPAVARYAVTRLVNDDDLSFVDEYGDVQIVDITASHCVELRPAFWTRMLVAGEPSRSKSVCVIDNKAIVRGDYTQSVLTFIKDGEVAWLPNMTIWQDRLELDFTILEI